ncbi:hypothetical protein PDE_02060 [Penicillium oxalicum 114-2]|uniref:Uncharacterized protein n=1 Tax=Penicillium oxalicum (strain 114-2 / CGMCC 5302) TaxID=933388 RepID=S7ZA78_PENO1|nr:hypothetical protein PDE_02060 [Penicillium oxalicum 114-2]
MSTSSYSTSSSSNSLSLASSSSHLPYHHPQPMSSLSLGSQSSRHTSTSTGKTPRFYSSPVQNGFETPLQLYGLERREPSIHEKRKRSRRISHALGEIAENPAPPFKLDTVTSPPINKLRRRSTFLRGSPPVSAAASSPRSMVDGPCTPQSEPGSAWSISTTQSHSFTHRLVRRLSVLSIRRKNPMQSSLSGVALSNGIGPSMQHGTRLQPGFI